MKRRGIITLLAICAAAFPSQMQAQNLQFGGMVYNHDLLLPSDLATLSQPQNLGTSRSMAMGGAFTSLGADMTSMSLNPAGLGMYRRNEVSVTPLVGVSHGETAGTASWLGNNKSRFSLANIGVALNVAESASSALTSVTMGFGMNRIADFNTRYSFSSDSNYNPTEDRLMPTIADVFGRQLGQEGIFPSSDGSLGYGNGVGTFNWPAILGYNAYLINAEGTGDDRQWVPSMIGHNASIRHSMDVLNTGSINEFTISAGANFNNIVYVGASLGIQSVYKRMDVVYQEEYLYPGTDGVALDGAGNVLPEQLGYSNLWQRSKIDGSGVNFKLGVVVRPVAGLRLGIAVHTPTFYSLDYSYVADIESRHYKNPDDHVNYDATDRTPVQYYDGGNSWEFISPTRLMFGASYTFGQYAILSVDYERDWYNGIRAKNVPYSSGLSSEFFKDSFKNDFRATNTLRAGLEVKPLPILALRVGGGYTSSMLKDESYYFNSPVATSNYYITGGVGVNLTRTVSIDAAYQYLSQKQSQYQLFFARDQDTGEFLTESGLYDTKLTRHFISMTLNVRF